MKSQFCQEEELKEVEEIDEAILLDEYYFLVPSRFIWDHWDELLEEVNFDDL